MFAVQLNSTPVITRECTSHTVLVLILWSVMLNSNEDYFCYYVLHSCSFCVVSGKLKH